jgi:hypothetical protein
MAEFEEKQWWMQMPFLPVGGSEQGSFDTNWSRYALSIQALKEKGTLYDFYARGMPKQDQNLKQYIETGFNARLITHSMRDEVAGQDEMDRYVYVWDDGGCSLSVNDDDGNIDFYGFSLNTKAIEQMKSMCKDSLSPTVSAGRAFVLVQSTQGITLKSIGVASVPMERTNYAEHVIAGYDHIVKDLQDVTPCGRIVILDGAPGTGKTFLIRGLLHSVQDAVFILVPAHMVASLASPDLIQAVVGKREYASKAATIFVIEDADECLLTRDGANQAAITSLLNVSDGILGNVVNIRIIASTNAPRMEMDNAIMRPGRLCRRIHVGPLTKTEAIVVASRLGKDANWCFATLKGDMTLADVYRAVRSDAGEAPAVEIERKGIMGFK